MMNKDEIIKQAKLELARRDLWTFCKLLDPKFYRNDRPHLKELCEVIQNFLENSEKDFLVINEPPRHGKSYTVEMSTAWVFKDINQKIMTGSYNEKLSTKFSKTVRNKIMEEKADESIVVYSDIFPHVKVKRGDAAANLWALEGAYDSYLATTPSGTSTGFGASLIIVDDLIKDAKEAYNPNVLEEHWSWFTNTILSRLEEGGKIIIIATRWNSQDLSGRVISEFGDRVETYTKAALVDEKKQEMLCPSLLSYKKYVQKIEKMDPHIASANYNQICTDTEGNLYKNLKTYNPKEIKDFVEVYSYCDTADEGQDYLCNIIWGIKNRKCYILDIYYTQDPMEITEPETARRLKENNVNYARIESNNGGRGFARSVIRILQEDLKHFKTTVKWFHQTENKLSRIRGSATWVMDNIYFPEHWNIIWPQFWREINRFQAAGGNLHDDAADALTGVAETSIKIIR